MFRITVFHATNWQLLKAPIKKVCEKSKKNGEFRLAHGIFEPGVQKSTVVQHDKKSCFREKTGLFLYFLTHTRKSAERVKKERKGSSAIYQMAFATFNAQYAYSFIF